MFLHACLQRHPVDRTVWFVPGCLINQALTPVMAALLPSYRVEHTHTHRHTHPPTQTLARRAGLPPTETGALFLPCACCGPGSIALHSLLIPSSLLLW